METSDDLRETRVRPPLHDLCEKDAAASSESVRPERLPSGQVDGEVGGGRIGPSGGDQGSEDPGRHARAVGRQLRLGFVRQAGAVTAARVTGTMMTKKKRRQNSVNCTNTLL